MAEEKTQTDSGQTDNTVNVGQTTDTKPDITKQSDSEFMMNTLDFIEDIKNKTQTNDNVNTKTDVSKSENNVIVSRLAGTDIPDVFSNAAEAAGMTQSEIIAFADGRTNEELIELIPYLQESLEDKDDDKQDNKKQDDKADKKDDKLSKDDSNKTIDTELESKIVDRISKQLEEKFGSTLAEIDKFKAYQEEQSTRQTVDRASKIFDEASKEFPVFGKTEELPKFTSGRLAGQLIPTSPALKVRLEVLRFADAFISQGAGIDDAMTNALATYKGLHLEKELERKTVRDLKQHETKLSGARVGRETKKKYADTREEIIDEIKQMQRAAGVV